jgi:hypothetical protein
VEPRTASPEDVLRGAVRASPAGGTEERSALPAGGGTRRGARVRGTAGGKMGGFTASDHQVTNSLDLDSRCFGSCSSVAQ